MVVPLDVKVSADTQETGVDKALSVEPTMVRERKAIRAEAGELNGNAFAKGKAIYDDDAVVGRVTSAARRR